MGLLKDENAKSKDMNDTVYNSQIVEAVALKSKIYSYRKENEKVNYKGIKDKNINFQSLKNALFNNETIKTKFYTIRSKNHKIYSYTDHKKFMAFSDKRYLYNPIMSYAYEHYMINKNYENMI